MGGGAGGFYTQAEYAGIVRYAQDRFVTVVPEIDMPGHTNAALVSHPALSCGRRSETLQRMADAPLTICPDCGGPLKKLISTSGFLLKGSGWYASDYARQKGGGAAKADGAAKDGSGDGDKPAAAPAKEGESAKPAADATSKTASS